MQQFFLDSEMLFVRYYSKILLFQCDSGEKSRRKKTFAKGLDFFGRFWYNRCIILACTFGAGEIQKEVY